MTASSIASVTRRAGVVAATAVLALAACSQKPAAKPGDLKAAAAQCMAFGDLRCAEENWRAYVAVRPTESNAIANLCIVESRRDEPEDAVVQCRKAIDLGEGAYDLFAAYASSLAKVGRTDEAIDWSYKTLAIVPNLVDVRGDLAKLLISRNRRYEAIVLLAEFDEFLADQQQGPYFAGQRIALESAMTSAGSAASTENTALRLPKLGDRFYAPVSVGSAPVAAFIVDTGASNTSVNDDLLAKAKIAFKVLRPRIDMELADGRRVRGRLIRIDQMRVGNFTLKDVPAVDCERCALLLGGESLSHFDMSSTKVAGVEFLNLRPRKPT